MNHFVSLLLCMCAEETLVRVLMNNIVYYKKDNGAERMPILFLPPNKEASYLI